MGTYIYRILGSTNEIRLPRDVNKTLLTALIDEKLFVPPFTVISGADVAKMEGLTIEREKQFKKKWNNELAKFIDTPLTYRIHYEGEQEKEALSTYSSIEDVDTLTFMADRLDLSRTGLDPNDTPFSWDATYLYYPRIISSDIYRIESIEVSNDALDSLYTLDQLEEAMKETPNILEPDYQETPPMFDYLMMDPDKEANINYKRLVGSKLGSVLSRYWGVLVGGEHYA